MRNCMAVCHAAAGRSSWPRRRDHHGRRGAELHQRADHEGELRQLGTAAALPCTRQPPLHQGHSAARAAWLANTRHPAPQVWQSRDTSAWELYAQFQDIELNLNNLAGTWYEVSAFFRARSG